MRTREDARQIILAHLAACGLPFDPSSHVDREGDERLLNWAARICNEAIPFPDAERNPGTK